MSKKRFKFKRFDVDIANINEIALYEIDNNPGDDLDDSNLFYVYSTTDANVQDIVDKLNSQEEEMQRYKCNDCDYKKECDVFRYGDIIDLKFANEIIDNQRGKIRELTKENTSLKKEIKLSKHIEEKLKRYGIGFKEWESDVNE